jgi:hypothetical protein
VLSIKLIYLELLISHFIRPVESAELPNVARASKSLETPALDYQGKITGMQAKNGTLETFQGKKFYFKEINKKQKLNS